jgi:PKD repeat protein
MRCTAVDLAVGLFSVLLLPLAGPAQPHCDILMRPAFNYSVVSYTVHFQQVSETYGQPVDPSWTFGDGATSTLAEPEHTYTAPGWYQACLTLTTPDGLCSSTYCRQVVVSGQDCAWDVAFGQTGASTNTAVFFDASSGVENAGWYWEFGDGTHSTDAYPSHMWALPGRHYVTLVRSDGTCVGSAGRWVEVDGNATSCGVGVFASFTEVYGENNVVVFHPEYVIGITAEPIGNIWSLGDGTLDTSWAAMHTYPGPGTYQVCMLSPVVDPVALDSCFTYVCRTIEVGASLGLEEAGADLGPRAWPVPFGSHLHVALGEAFNGALSARLSDALGRPVVWTHGHGTITLDTGHLAPGTYILSIEANGVPLRHRQVMHE